MRTEAQKQRRKEPEVVYVPPADPVADLFDCPTLHARFTRAFCVFRQKRQARMGGTACLIKLFAGPEDVYCRSGECALGRRNMDRVKKENPSR